MTSPPVLTRELHLDDFEVALREAGRPGDPSILCVHGGPGLDGSYFFPDERWWDSGLRRLADRYHVIAYDQRGCGGSTVPDADDALAISHFVDDIERVRVALELERPAIFGHSFGSVLAVLYAIRHPGKAGTLILAGGAPTRAFIDGFREAVAEELDEPARRQLAELGAGELTDAAFRARFETALPLYFHELPEGERRRALLDPLHFSARVNRALAAGLEAYDLTPALPHVDRPTLVIYGESDRVVQPRYQLTFRGKLPRARFVAFMESGHFPFLEEPEPFARVVDYFLRHANRPADPE